jgi:hypothetical protein
MITEVTGKIANLSHSRGQFRRPTVEPKPAARITILDQAIVPACDVAGFLRPLGMSWLAKLRLQYRAGGPPRVADTAWRAPFVALAEDSEPETMWSEFNLNAPPRHRPDTSSRPSGSA